MSIAPERHRKRTLDVEERKKLLEHVLDTRGERVFVGISYEAGELILGEIKIIVRELGMIPIVERDYNVAPDEIHDVAMWLLHQCKYAIFDITHPAGQLMELERSLDYPLKTFVCYSAKHPSAMPLTFMETLRKQQKGEIFKYSSSEALHKFIRAVLVDRSPRYTVFLDKFKYLIESQGLGGKSRYKENEMFLIFPMGTLEKSLEKGDIQKINRFKGVKILVTGWDMRSIEKLLSKRARSVAFSRWYVVAEHCLLSSLTTQHGKCQLGDKERLYDENGLEIDYVKACNMILVESILDHRRGPVYFLSQGNEAGICYYLNPPLNIWQTLKDYHLVSTEECDVGSSLYQRFGFKSENVPSALHIMKFPTRDEHAKELLLYAIARVNAESRTFLPYSLKFDRNSVALEVLREAEVEKLSPSETFTFEDIKKITQEALIKIQGKYRESVELLPKLLKRIQPQDDIAIDIFCKTKDEVLETLLSKVINKEKRRRNLAKGRLPLVVYISSGRETDIPMILTGYDLGYPFVAVGPQRISDRLKDAGVVPAGETLGEVIELLQKLSGKEAK